jgi:hypothetical protein
MFDPDENLQLPSDHEKVWKYLSFSKFCSLLINESLFFTRIDKFLYEDPFEGFLSKKDLEKKSKFEKNFYGYDVHQLRTPEYFACCFHYNEYESAAMWKIYSNNNEGIAIQTTIKSLKDSFQYEDYAIKIGKIQYIDYEKNYTNNTQDSHLYRFFYKRQTFEHEKELRCIIHEPKFMNEYTRSKSYNHILKKDDCINPPPICPGFNVKIRLNEFIKAIYICPTAPEWFSSTVEKTVGKMGINIEDSKIKIEKSGLHQRILY